MDRNRQKATEDAEFKEECTQFPKEEIQRLKIGQTADLAFCNYHKDGTSTSREPRQAYETHEVGHSQLCGSHGI